jgi:hypothetical protein
MAKTRPEIPTPVFDLLVKQGETDLAMLRRIRLTERALAGDVEAMIEWLALDDPKWRDALNAVRAAAQRRAER